MNRVLFGLFTFLVVLNVASQADEVYIRGRDKVVAGTIVSEDAKSVVVNVVEDKKKKGTQTFPAIDVIEVISDAPSAFGLTLANGPYKAGVAAEKEADTEDQAMRRKYLTLAIGKYDETLKGMKGKDTAKLAVRNLEYKIAMLYVKRVTDEVSSDLAVKKLQEFVKAHRNSWQVHQAMPLIAKLQMDNKDFDQAAKTFEMMAEMEVLAPAVRQEAELRVVEVNVRAGNFKEANSKLDALQAKTPKNSPFASRLKLERAEVLIGFKKEAEAIPVLLEIIRDPGDRNVKARAHNALGDHYFKAQKFSEAMWEYLWVDAVYNQDKSQHARALYQLWKTFDQLNDGDRAQQCRESLISDRQFAGTEHQIKAVKEVK
ncbi:MAG: hypothetical protein FJ303_01660 [Planctomycetes bacterium]|nr:hypothetical protein [Planctomycetota bacterium]